MAGRRSRSRCNCSRRNYRCSRGRAPWGAAPTFAGRHKPSALPSCLRSERQAKQTPAQAFSQHTSSTQNKLGPHWLLALQEEPSGPLPPPLGFSGAGGQPRGRRLECSPWGPSAWSLQLHVKVAQATSSRQADSARTTSRKLADLAPSVRHGVRCVLGAGLSPETFTQTMQALGSSPHYSRASYCGSRSSIVCGGFLACAPRRIVDTPASLRLRAHHIRRRLGRLVQNFVNNAV